MAKKIAITLLATLMLSGSLAHALGPVDLEAELGLFNKYVWRGIVATPDPVLQPRASMGLVGFKLDFWGNVDMSDVNEMEWRFNEVNWTLSYGLGLALVHLEAGVIYYDLKVPQVPDTAELFLAGNVSVILSPKLVIYQDVDAYEGTHVRGSISHGSSFSQTFGWKLGAELGWGSVNYVNGYFGYGDEPFPAGFTDGFIGLSLPWHPVIMTTITPSVGWASLTGDARVDDGEDNDTVVYGLKAMVSF